MKKNNKLRKVLLALCCAMLLVAISVGATVAYLTDKATATNTFTVGHVDIDLHEANVDEYGEVIDETRVKENDYKLIPGHEYVKDPTVTIKGDSEEAYIRMLVAVEGLEGLKAVFPDDVADGTFLLQNFVTEWDPAIWVFEGFDAGKSEYEFRYHETVSTVDGEDMNLEPLFETIKFPGENVTNNNIDQLDGVKVNVVAQAIQADTFADADAAWAAFKTDSPAWEPETETQG